MNILGIYGSFSYEYEEISRTFSNHDGGATLISNGKHLFSISEERLSKIKHDGRFPKLSIEFCLKNANLSHEDIDMVVYPLDTLHYFQKKDEILFFLKNIFKNSKIEFISHHKAHSLSSIYSSPFNEGCCITQDGNGSIIPTFELNDFSSVESGSISYFNKEKSIFNFFQISSPLNNFGHFYQTWSHKIYCEKIKKYINFHDNRYKETFPGKVMGLSGYGKVENLDSKQYSINTEGTPHISFKCFGDAHSINDLNHLSPEDKSATVQNIFENSLFDYIKSLKEQSYLRENVCFAGGIFLNVLSNTNLKKLVPNMHIPPFPNDVGLHFGAASYGLLLLKQDITLPNNIALLGKEYSNQEIVDELKLTDLNYVYYDSFEDLASITSQYLHENKIIGWFQNKSEFGPRALGSRSILTNAQYKKNKNILNSRVKHREYWRPFAGIILDEYIQEYFEEGFITPYMVYSQTVKKEQIKNIEAITHVDNTCRIQTVNNNLHPQITTLLKEYYKISGVPILLNTSFNDNGQPIVETPYDAVNAFINMDMDYLVIGNFIASKNDRR